MKKRIISFIMASILVISATACSNTSGGESKNTTESSVVSTASVVSDSSTENSDRQWLSQTAKQLLLNTGQRIHLL